MKSELYVTDRKDWRAWLEENHAKEKEVWLIYFKKHTGKLRIPYDDAVEEALCFGWIDSIVRKIDDERYCQKFTPRKENSNWSMLNKQRVEKLRKNGRMTKAGLEKVKAVKVNGSWEKRLASEKSFDMAMELADGLDKNTNAKDYFDSLSPSFRKQYIGWIASAKKEETKQRRVSETIGLLERKQKLGMK